MTTAQAALLLSVAGFSSDIYKQHALILYTIMQMEDFIAAQHPHTRASDRACYRARYQRLACGRVCATAHEFTPVYKNTLQQYFWRIARVCDESGISALTRGGGVGARWWTDIQDIVIETPRCDRVYKCIRCNIWRYYKVYAYQDIKYVCFKTAKRK